MPVNKARHTVLRHWAMLRLLPSWPNTISYGDLARKLKDEDDFAVDPNTIRRDIDQLSLMFPIVIDDSEKTHSVGWAKGADPVVRTMPVTEAMALVMAEQHLGQLLPTSVFESLTAIFSRAHQTLKHIEGLNTAADWMHKVRAIPPTQPVIPANVSAEIHELISKALLSGKQIQADYRSAFNQEARSFRLHPLGLILRVPGLYMVATAWNYHELKDIHLYALHRFVNVTLLDEDIVTPVGFEIDNEIQLGLADFGGRKTPIRLRIEVNRELANILHETPLAQRTNPPSTNQTIKQVSDDLFEVEVSVTESWQLEWWLRQNQDRIVSINKDC